MFENRGIVISVSKCGSHLFSKKRVESISLIKGEGVEGDAHRGTIVKHVSRVASDPNKPNLRQVHLMHFELIEELREMGFDVLPATLGENITTKNIDLLSLPTGAKLNIGCNVVIEVTGLRNPCAQLDNYQQGLTKAVLDHDAEGNLIRKSGIMGIVERGGVVKTDDEIKVVLPPEPHKPLDIV